MDGAATVKSASSFALLMFNLPLSWAEPLIFCGDGASRYRSLIEQRPEWTIHAMDLYLASTIAEMAAMPNSGPLAPLYVRMTDAEVARESIGSPDS